MKKSISIESLWHISLINCFFLKLTIIFSDRSVILIINLQKKSLNSMILTERILISPLLLPEKMKDWESLNKRKRAALSIRKNLNLTSRKTKRVVSQLILRTIKRIYPRLRLSLALERAIVVAIWPRIRMRPAQWSLILLLLRALFRRIFLDFSLEFSRKSQCLLNCWLKLMIFLVSIKMKSLRSSSLNL